MRTARMAWLLMSLVGWVVATEAAAETVAIRRAAYDGVQQQLTVVAKVDDQAGVPAVYGDSGQLLGTMDRERRDTWELVVSLGVCDTPSTVTVAVTSHEGEQSATSSVSFRRTESQDCGPTDPPPPPVADSDGDGVVDGSDQCPGTPLGTEVAANGCPVVPELPPVTGSHAGRFDHYDGGATCVTCHPGATQDAFASTHYQWSGKLSTMNDFCTMPDFQFIGAGGGCSKCHAGRGKVPTNDDNYANVDCLVCHSSVWKRTVANTPEGYRWVGDEAAMGVSELQAAVQIARPSSSNCLGCHAGSGGGNNFKRGDLTADQDAVDMHMVRGQTCTSCHSFQNHAVAGVGADLRYPELGDVRCQDCHGDQHGTSGSSGSRARHTQKLDCTTCHIPTFARHAETDMYRDYAEPGVLGPGGIEPAITFGSDLVPAYRWWNGTSTFYEFGSVATRNPDGRVTMAAPNGSAVDGKLYPFKHHIANMPVDSAGRLIPVSISVLKASGGDNLAAIRAGAEGAFGTYTGHTYVEAERYLGIFHDVRPKEQALGCGACHEQLGSGGRFEWEALGYGVRAERNGRPLCSSCHGSENAGFTDVHSRHVDHGYACSTCHTGR